MGHAHPGGAPPVIGQFPSNTIDQTSMAYQQLASDQSMHTIDANSERHIIFSSKFSWEVYKFKDGKVKKLRK